MNDRILEKLRAQLPDAIVGHEEFRGDFSVFVRKQDIVAVASYLKSDPELAFTMAIDITGVDYYLPADRFEVVYHIYSLKNKKYLRLRVRVDEQDLEVPSVTGVWLSANWHERETYDMFGITFAHHPDLRRFYMPEEFEYYPLRKDFPLMGIPDSLPLPRR